MCKAFTKWKRRENKPKSPSKFWFNSELYQIKDRGKSEQIKEIKPVEKPIKSDFYKSIWLKLKIKGGYVKSSA